ncbi:MAG TPA: hypothetical protein VI814_09220 [Candidatus Limnocylindria bacterium]
MAKKTKQDPEHEGPVDLASRIGARPAPAPAPPRPPAEAPLPPRLDGPLPSRRDRPTFIGGEEPSPPPVPTFETPEEEQAAPPIVSPRTPPRPGEIDIVATPLPTLDDWHRFELALRKVRGVGQVRTEYYRHGVLKVRVSYEGHDRLAHALRVVPGYRVRVIGEDRTTIQILVSSEGDERRPG